MFELNQAHRLPIEQPFSPRWMYIRDLVLSWAWKIHSDISPITRLIIAWGKGEKVQGEWKKCEMWLRFFDNIRL